LYFELIQGKRRGNKKWDELTKADLESHQLKETEEEEEEQEEEQD
jgi:hypothetical protein